MRDKNQVMMFSDAELDLIKKTFADNEELLYAIRNVMLQFPVSDAEREALKSQVTPEVFALLKKKLLPEISPDAPLTQLADLRQTLTNDLKTKTPEEMAPLFSAKVREMAYLEQQFEVLNELANSFISDSPRPLKLDDWKLRADMSADDAFVATTARNFILGFVDPMLRDFSVLAGTKTESPEKQKERLMRNSAK
jgi:hypothetical protein